MAVPQFCSLRRLLEPLGCVLANGLEHPEAISRVAEKALVDERLHRFELCVRNGLGRGERAAAAEDRESTEKTLTVVVQQLVAPFDRRPERPLTLGQISCATGEERQAVLEPGEDFPGCEGLHPNCRQVEREREMVEPAADLGNRLVRLEAGLHGPRPRIEEGDPLPLLQRRHRVLLLCGEAQPLAARHENIELRAGLEHLAECRTGLDQVLEVVEQKEHPLLADVLGEPACCPDHLRDRRRHQLRIPERGKRYPPDAIGIVAGHGSRRL